MTSLNLNDDILDILIRISYISEKWQRLKKRDTSVTNIVNNLREINNNTDRIRKLLHLHNTLLKHIKEDFYNDKILSEYNQFSHNIKTIMHSSSIDIVTIVDEEYPQLLKQHEIKDQKIQISPPIVLYRYGKPVIKTMTVEKYNDWKNYCEETLEWEAV